MRKIAPLLLAALALVAARVAAAAGGGLTPEVISHLLIPQVINFSILVTTLFFLLRKPLQKHFASKAAVFEQQKELAEKARQEAEAKNLEIRNKIQQVESTAEQILVQAKSDAMELRNKLVTEAKAQAQRIEDESFRMSKFEHERAILMLRTELITNPVRFAESKIKENSAGDVQNKLNNDFINKVGAVSI
jgi:F-type H+-transporting ATPase subunit b